MENLLGQIQPSIDFRGLVKYIIKTNLSLFFMEGFDPQQNLSITY